MDDSKFSEKSKKSMDDKVFYFYVENGKTILTDEEPDFRKIHSYIVIKPDSVEIVSSGKNKDSSLPDEPIDVAAMLIRATVISGPPKYGTLYPVLEDKQIEIPKYDVPQLQEIAMHLMAYCDTQERGCAYASCEGCEPKPE